MNQLPLPLGDAPVWQVVKHPFWADAVAVQNRITGKYAGYGTPVAYTPTIAILADWKAKRLNEGKIAR